MKKLTPTLLVTMIFTIVMFTYGQNINLQQCSSIATDTERLACYDSLANQPEYCSSDTESWRTECGGDGVYQTQAAQPATSDSKWFIDSSTDPITDFKKSFAMLDAKEGRSSYGDDITLVLRCSSNGAEVYIIWDDFLGSDDAYVTYRIDSQTARANNWSLSTDNDTTFYPNDDQSFILDLSTAQKLVAQVTPYNESPVTAVFDLSGITEAIQPIRQGCGF